MSLQRKIRLTWEGWFYLVVLCFILGGAILREVNLLFVLAGMLAGPLILSLRSVSTALGGVEIARTMPQGVCAGDPLMVNLQLRNTRHRVGSFAVAVEEKIELNEESSDKHVVYFPYVPAGQSRKQAYRGRLSKRGRYLVGPFRVSTRFPFGLVRRSVTMGETDSILIYPRLGKLTRRWAARQYEAFEGGRRQRQRYHRAEGEYYGVRDWREGDSRRSIHWRSSARMGRLVVRQFEQPHTRDLALLVDLWKPEEAVDKDLEKVEEVVSFAATVVTDVCRQGNANLLLATTGKSPQHVSGPASVALLQDAMEQLAMADAGGAISAESMEGGGDDVDEPDGDNRLFEMLAQVVDKIDSAAEVVLISTREPNLTCDKRMASLWDSAARRALFRRIRVINNLSEFFQLDGGTNKREP